MNYLLIIVLYQYNQSTDQYLRLFFSLDNPLLFILLFLIIFLTLIVLTSKKIITPIRQKHFEEKKDLELKNARLSALFAELDPSPLIRINPEGQIIHFNDSAASVLKDNTLKSKNINLILREIKFDAAELILNNRSINHTEKIGENYFSINIKGISFLNIAQIYFHDITQRKAYEEQLKKYQENLRKLSRNIQMKAEEERNRIAAELHDSVGQELSLLKLKVQQFNSEANNRQELLRSVDNITNEVRSILYQLKPKVLSELGIFAAVTSLIEKLNSEIPIVGFVSIVGNEKRFQDDFEINLFRVIQEAINNIIKHSKASEYGIHLIFKHDSLRVIISDDGIGFELNTDSNSLNGYGFINMKERIECLNGSIKIDSTLNQGTSILIDLPTISELKND